MTSFFRRNFAQTESWTQFFFETKELQEAVHALSIKAI